MHCHDVLGCFSLCLVSLGLTGGMGSFLWGEDPAPGRQVEQKLPLGDGKWLDYLLYLPDDYVPDRKSPLLLFLHGRGESNGPLAVVKTWGPPRLVAEGHRLPYVIASPQCPPSPSSWSQAAEQLKLTKLLAYLQQTYQIDEGRMYLTGLSMGGSGAWLWAGTHPDTFAAVVPICGRGNPADAEKLKDVPIWVWHGLRDSAVPPSTSQEMVNAIRQAGGSKVILTTLEGIGHNCWSAAYASPDLYSWLNRHALEVQVEKK